MSKRNQLLRGLATSPRRLQPWRRMVVLVALGCVAAPPSAQNCTASNPQLAVAVLEKVLDACASPDEVQAMQMKYGHDVILEQASIQGNLLAALLRFGDQKIATQVAPELNERPIYPGYFPFEAIRKLRFAGGKTAVGILIDGLGNSNRMSQDAQKNFDACVVRVVLVSQPSQEQKEAAQKQCAGFFTWPDRRTGLILNALAEMVKNLPLPANVPITSESSQRWKDWWLRNRDKAVFVIPPRASYDWH